MNKWLITQERKGKIAEQVKVHENDMKLECKLAYPYEENHGASSKKQKNRITI